MEATLERKVNLNISLQADLPEVPEGQTAAQAVLQPLLARLANLTVSEAPMDLEALMARLANENSEAKEESAKRFLRSVYSRVLARMQESSQILEKNRALLEQAATLGTQLEGIESQLTAQKSALEEFQKKCSSQSAAVTELEIKTAMLERQVELVKSQQLTPAEKRVAELKKKRMEAQEKAQQDDLDQQIAKAEKELLSVQASLATAQGELASAQGALATAQGNLVAMQSQVSAATKKLAELQTTRNELEHQITALTDQLSDEELAQALAEAIKATAGEVDSTPAALPKRSAEEEAYLEEHSVVKILQDAADQRGQQMQDVIEAGREPRV